MPLIKSTSRPAFGHNVKAEIAAGKPLKQSLAIAYSEKRAAMKKHRKEHAEHSGVTGEHAGESHITRHPSNSSSANPKSGRSWAQQPQPHSQHSARRSDAYHKTAVESSYVRPTSTKMTRAEHQLNNDEEVEGVGSYTKRLK